VQGGRGGTPWTVGAGQAGRRRIRWKAWDGFHSPHNPEVAGSIILPPLPIPKTVHRIRNNGEAKNTSWSWAALSPPYHLGQMRGLRVVTPAPPRSTVYRPTACRFPSTCLTCSCPASRANFSVMYAHVAAHPHEQVGRLTSRLPSFSERIVMLWVTLLIFLLLPEESFTPNLPVPTDETTTRVTASPLIPMVSSVIQPGTAYT
jgi:hypothetical protein